MHNENLHFLKQCTTSHLVSQKARELLWHRSQYCRWVQNWRHFYTIGSQQSVGPPTKWETKPAIRISSFGILLKSFVSSYELVGRSIFQPQGILLESVDIMLQIATRMLVQSSSVPMEIEETHRDADDQAN